MTHDRRYVREIIRARAMGDTSRGQAPLPKPQVSRKVSQARKTACEACGQFKKCELTRTRTPCGCAAAWSDPEESCTLSPPVWGPVCV
jgi:hypothetical protein